jgi:hypothetical protein
VEAPAPAPAPLPSWVPKFSAYDKTAPEFMQSPEHENVFTKLTVECEAYQCGECFLGTTCEYKHSGETLTDEELEELLDLEDIEEGLRASIAEDPIWQAFLAKTQGYEDGPEGEAEEEEEDGPEGEEEEDD